MQLAFRLAGAKLLKYLVVPFLSRERPGAAVHLWNALFRIGRLESLLLVKHRQRTGRKPLVQLRAQELGGFSIRRCSTMFHYDHRSSQRGGFSVRVRHIKDGDVPSGVPALQVFDD